MVVFVVSLFVVVVFVAPSSYVVVLVLSYPPVMFVLLPDVFVWVFVSSAIRGFDIKINVSSISNNAKFVSVNFMSVRQLDKRPDGRQNSSN